MHQQNKGKLYVVATPIGNLQDMSVRAQEVLSHVAWIAAEDTRHSKGLLQHLGISTALISYHEHNERERSAELIAKLAQGEDGALISDAGTPLISDPGYSLVAQAHENGIPVIPIPGPCALITALSASGLPTDKFLFEGFLPAKSAARVKRLEELSSFTHTMVFYEAPHRLIYLLEDLIYAFEPSRAVTFARELTKKFESIHRSTLEQILVGIQNNEITLKGECVLVVAGAPKKESPSETAPEMDRILRILMSELSLKQSVQLAVKLTGLPKNALYEHAMKLKEN